MFPIRDDIPHRKLPIINYSLILVNFIFFFYELGLGQNLKLFIFQYGVVPQRFLLYLNSSYHISLSFLFISIIISMFLHAGWLHILGNMWFLFIFGDNVEDMLGHFRYLIFYLSCGIAASFLHIIFNANSPIPSIGASGAIAGVLGAYMIFYPHAKILTLLPIFIFFEIIELPALLWIGLWILIQIVFGLFSIGSTGGGIAWWAHIGGFSAGIIYATFFLKKKFERKEINF